MPDLLIELFSEEIPARMQVRAAADLKKLVTDALVEAGLTYASAGAFSTPRRLALSVEGLSPDSPDTREERKGPRADAPEKALAGFLRATGLTRDQLEIRPDKKGDVFFAVIKHAGRPATEIIAEVLEITIRTFPWPKSMRWGASALKWVRPLHSILCILSDEAGTTVVPLTIDCIQSGDSTSGHPFMAPMPFKVSGFDDYAAKLKKAHVQLNADTRASQIWSDATNLAFAQNLEVVEDAALLAEVAGLVEWPVVLMGDIVPDYLDLPPEVLQTSMRAHQKFFSVRNPKTARIEKFITVANIDAPDNGATILAGNERVLAARLADAKFFWENDLRVAKAGMGDWLAALENVTFHNKLGSQADRIKRIAALAREIAPLVNADPDEAEAAAKVAKADLSSQMVTEFPELQGVMGRYYAKSAGLSDAVAQASEEHYAPLGPSDNVPSAPVSVAVALADKIDTLTGFWANEKIPTGSKDPFALRRSALGVVRTLHNNSLLISLRPIFGVLMFDHLMRPNYAQGFEAEEVQFFLEKLREDLIKLEFENIQFAAEKLVDEFFNRDPSLNVKESNSVQDLVGTLVVYLDDLLTFFHDRLKINLRDRDIRHDIIDACIAMRNSDDLTLLVKRATALSNFLKTDDGENLLQGFKRANNILAQAEQSDGVEYSYGADIKFAKDPTEKMLFKALASQGGAISSAIEAEDFAAAMRGMAALRAPIDAFFEAVQINTDNAIIRRNRLNLLADIRKLCLGVADLTLIGG